MPFIFRGTQTPASWLRSRHPLHPSWKYDIFRPFGSRYNPPLIDRAMQTLDLLSDWPSMWPLAIESVLEDFDGYEDFFLNRGLTDNRDRSHNDCDKPGEVELKENTQQFDNTQQHEYFGEQDTNTEEQQNIRDEVTQTNHHQRRPTLKRHPRMNGDEYFYEHGQNLNSDFQRDNHQNTVFMNRNRKGSNLHASHNRMKEDLRRPASGRHEGQFQRRHLQPVRQPRHVDIYSIDVPDYRPGELHVRSEGDRLKISGRKVCRSDESCTLREFERVTKLPTGIPTSSITATLDRKGTLSIQGKALQTPPGEPQRDRDIIVEGIDLPQIKDSDTKECVKKSTLKLRKINGKTGQRVEFERQNSVPESNVNTFEHYEDDGVSIEVVDEY